MHVQQLQLEVISRLKVNGYKLIIDDFGLGYFSLTRLHALELAYLKIDASLIATMLQDSNVMQIVHASINLSKQVGMNVIASGVETEETLNLLTSWGCSYAQGYYFYEPQLADADALTKKLMLQKTDIDVVKDSYLCGNHLRRIGHDINNQLASLLGYSELLLHKNNERLQDEFLLEILQKIQTKANLALNEVADLSEKMKTIQKNTELPRCQHHQLLLQIDTVAAEKSLAMIDFVTQLDVALHQLRDAQNNSALGGFVQSRLQRMYEAGFKLKELMLKLKQFSCE